MMSNQVTLKDFWTSARKAVAVSGKLTAGIDPPPTGSDSLTRTTSFDPITHGRKRKATSAETKPPRRRRLAQDQNIKSDIPSKASNFSFLDLPFDIQHIMRNQYFDARDLISLSQTCCALRLDCLDSYMRNQGVISQTFDGGTEINLPRNAPRLTVVILTSSLLNYYSRTNVSITIHLPHLIYFQRLLYDLFHSFTGKITNFTLLFYRRDHSFLSNSSLPPSLTMVLSYIGGRCITVDISEATTHRNIEEPDDTQHDDLHFDNIGDASVVPVLQEIGLRHLVNGILFLKLDIHFFRTPSLRRILSSLIIGRSICELSAVCPTIKEYQAFIALLFCPMLESLQVVVCDSFPIFLSDQFIQNHKSLERLSLINAVKGNSPIHPPNDNSILHLPPLRELSISANYSGWTMADSSRINSFTIESLSLVVRPQNSQKYCSSIRSLVEPIARYPGPLPPNFLLELKFPAELTRHISPPRSTKWQPRDCICSPCNRDKIAANIRSLRLRFDTINRHIAAYLMRWLAWFPELRTLEIEHSDSEGVDFCFTSRELIDFRSQCCAMLECFQCTEIWNEPIVWRYYSSGVGWLQT